MNIEIFQHQDFLPALKEFFKSLNVPVNYITDEPTTVDKILLGNVKDSEAFNLIEDVYFLGMVDDKAFEKPEERRERAELENLKEDYDGILIFGIFMGKRENGLLPTRSQLAEISRAFNREFKYTPVVVVFRYDNFLAFANTERISYKQVWKEGEKAGKVSLLRDIDINNPHSGHQRILSDLQIKTSGKNNVDSYASLYAYWQEVFSVSVLSKKFYKELSNWYFWAAKHVVFPGVPTAEEAHLKGSKLEELQQEHKAKNVIRLLTRLLFVWFIKEKKLIPEELFDLESLQKQILKDISPYQNKGMFKEASKESIYYKAILQNLFFATLNCPIEADEYDNRTRGFRGDETYGKHRGIDWMMRYKNNFKDPDAFLKMVNDRVPFLNGGLFECLDDKTQNLYIDGFSDQMTKGEQLIVPDFLFFGVEENVDLSVEYGIKTKGAKNAAVKGLINILTSYKFTITENTPIEEDVALDPELLGKVFENLLASYNPETKSTARKQTGSFYTPREIVNYMVDESLIAYLKNAINEWDLPDDDLDKDLHSLASYDSTNPFNDNQELQEKIITALSRCTILDPACGSGAFPMGILQKMVHILQKLDPENIVWKEVQLNKALEATEDAYAIEDKKEREEKLLEINNAFDERVNDPDYARKLYLIENCIYGVDIQPIATQISKLRFFISLVVDQKVNTEKHNFGIRPLPNLETRFVTANTLVGIEKPSNQHSLYDTENVKNLETELKKVRHKLFSAKTKDTKLKYRKKDEELRNAIAEELKKNGWGSNNAEQLAKWDPYDQNASSPFFDPEWMFDIPDGFDIVIGNPPYGADLVPKEFYKLLFPLTSIGNIDSYKYFIDRGLSLIKSQGSLFYITSDSYLEKEYFKDLRELIVSKNRSVRNVKLGDNIFENVNIPTALLHIMNSNVEILEYVDVSNYAVKEKIKNINSPISLDFISEFTPSIDLFEIPKAKNLIDLYDQVMGVKIYQVGKGKPKQGKEEIEQDIFVAKEKKGEEWWTFIDKGIQRYYNHQPRSFIKYGPWLAEPRNVKFFKNEKIVIREVVNPRIFASYVDYPAVVKNTAAVIIPKNNEYTLKFLIGILNSKLFDFYISSKSAKRANKAFPSITSGLVKRFPIPETNFKQRGVIQEMVDRILIKIQQEKKIEVEDKILDILVYKIYGLSYKQINFIDPDFSLSEEEYLHFGPNQFEEIS